MINMRNFVCYTISILKIQGGVIMLGISLYPDKTKIEDDIVYLELAHTQGYQRVFMSMLQIDINNPKKSIDRLKESIAYANTLGMLVTLDIHPMVFDYLKIKEYDLLYFHTMKVDTIRLDSGINGRVEALMTRNPYGIKIEVNMSNETKYLDLIDSYHPQKANLHGSHNFYPQRYTGLSLEAFKRCSKKFQEYHIHSAAFITSRKATISPWPVSEGHCTLEMHRDLPIELQAKHLRMLGLVDDIIIGNAYASKEELKKVKEAYLSSKDVIQIEVFDTISDLEREMLFKYEHEYRGDASEYVIRSSKNRSRYHTCDLPPKQEVQDICKGDILILNEDYGQYKSEVQIALCNRIGDPRINVVGKICEDNMLLLELLKPFQSFVLEEKR